MDGGWGSNPNPVVIVMFLFLGGGSFPQPLNLLWYGGGGSWGKCWIDEARQNLFSHQIDIIIYIKTGVGDGGEVDPTLQLQQFICGGGGRWGCLISPNPLLLLVFMGGVGQLYI